MTKLKPARLTRTQWEKLIEDKAESPLTIEKYCKQKQVTVSSFYAWRTRLKKAQIIKSSNKVPDEWLPISLPASLTQEKSRWDIELALPSGITLRMKSAEC
mgnify:CR=1 FL=1